MAEQDDWLPYDKQDTWPAWQPTVIVGRSTVVWLPKDVLLADDEVSE